MSVKLYYTGAAGIFSYRSAPSGKEYVFYCGTPTDVSIPGDVAYFKEMISQKGDFRIGPLVKKKGDEAKQKTDSKKEKEEVNKN